jgi:hypothetical protein
MIRKKSSRATKVHVLEAARKILKKHFNPKRHLEFSTLVVEVSFYDEEYCFWPVRIRRRGYVASVGHMEFYADGKLKKCSSADEVKSILETFASIRSAKKNIGRNNPRLGLLVS